MQSEQLDAQRDEAEAGPGVSRGLRYMATGAFFFSVMSLLVKLAGQTLPSQEIVFARSLVMTVLSFLLLKRLGMALLGTRRRLLVVRGLLGFAALSCFYYAIVHLPLADATVIQYTNPAFAAVFAVFVLGERMRRREVVCVMLSLIGVLLVAQPGFLFGSDSGLDPTAAGVALLGAVLSAAAYVTVRQLAAEHHLVVIFYFAVISTLGAVPGTLLNPVLPNARELLLLLGVGVMTHLGQVYMTRGLHLERAGRATATALVQIVFAGVWGAIFFSQIPGPLGMIGAALVVAGVLLLGRS
ncbi:MAG: DMT family transporter [Gemmatimonadetes bacterium]|nr:DMT family transporter [Gemmatimonadota bacterium]